VIERFAARTAAHAASHSTHHHQAGTLIVGQAINDRATFPKFFEVSLRVLVSSELTLS
jgi:hypothetical protein